MRLLAALILCLGWTLPAFAQKDVAPAALVGKWVSSATDQRGATITATVVFRQDMIFEGTASVNDKPVWVYSGTWSLSDTVLTWRYETSTLQQVPPGYVDTDEIVSVDSEKLVLLSRLSGKRNTFRRTR